MSSPFGRYLWQLIPLHHHLNNTSPSLVILITVDHVTADSSSSYHHSSTHPPGIVDSVAFKFITLAATPLELSSITLVIFYRAYPSPYHNVRQFMPAVLRIR